MNYLEKSLINDTVLNAGMLAALVAWVLLASPNVDLSPVRSATAQEAVAVSGAHAPGANPHLRTARSATAGKIS